MKKASDLVAILIAVITVFLILIIFKSSRTTDIDVKEKVKNLPEIVAVPAQIEIVKTSPRETKKQEKTKTKSQHSTRHRHPKPSPSRPPQDSLNSQQEPLLPENQAPSKKESVPARPVYVSFSEDMVKSGLEHYYDKALPIVFNDISSVGLKEYISAMKRAGGRLFLVDLEKDEVFAELDKGLSLKEKGMEKKLKKELSFDRPRDITSDVPDKVIRRLKAKTGLREIAVIIAMPRSFEAGIIGALIKSLDDIYSFSDLYGETKREGDLLCFRLKNGMRKNGKNIKLDVRIPLVR